MPEQPKQEKTPPAKVPPETNESETTRWWRKPIVWAGGVGTVVVAGVLTGVLINVLTPPVQRLTGPVGPAVAPTEPTVATKANSAGKRHGQFKPSVTSPTKPLSVVSEDPLNLDELGVWVFPDKITLSPSQHARVNMLMRQALVNVYLIPNLANYFYSLGGYAISADTQVVLQDDSNQPASILDMRVIKNCGSPLSGTLFDSPGQSGDDDVRIGFNLDSANTDAEFARGWNTAIWKPNYFESRTISFSPGEQRVLNIRAVTERHSCTFSYRATVLKGKTKFYQTIDDDGQPFRLSAIVYGRSSTLFARYASLYIGGVMSMIHYHGDYVKENPRTYNGGPR